MALDAHKKELLLSLDSFNKPAELKGKDAWVRLLLNLLFLTPGTYPSMPEMGVGIQLYEFEFMDNAINTLNEAIHEQVRIYLPDLPITDIQVTYTYQDNGIPILIIVVTFNDNGSVDTSAIAAVVSDNIINFDIGWAS